MSLQKYTQEGLEKIAEGTGLSVPAISRIFGGHRIPSVSAAERIAEYLGMEVGAFYKALKELRNSGNG